MSSWIDVEQNTEEWFNLRAGKITGSAIKDIMANYPKSWGNPGKNRARKVATERMKGGPLQEVHYSNKHIERGHEQEPDALFLYYDQFQHQGHTPGTQRVIPRACTLSA